MRKIFFLILVFVVSCSPEDGLIISGEPRINDDTLRIYSSPQPFCSEEGEDDQCHQWSRNIVFDVGRNEVTQAEWAEVMEAAGYVNGLYPSFHSDESGLLPVDSINVFETLVFLNRKSELAGLSKCYNLVIDGVADVENVDQIEGAEEVRLDCFNSQTIGQGCSSLGNSVQTCLSDDFFYCDTPSQIRTLEGCNGYRLPRNRDWVRMSVKNSIEVIDGMEEQDLLQPYKGWCRDNSARNGIVQTHPVGSFPSEIQNDYFVYPLNDLGGNVSEFISFLTVGERLEPDGDRLVGYMVEGGSITRESQVYQLDEQTYSDCRGGVESRKVVHERARSFDVGFRYIRGLPRTCHFGENQDPLRLSGNDLFVYSNAYCN